jgi:hypothetical protein
MHHARGSTTVSLCHDHDLPQEAVTPSNCLPISPQKCPAAFPQRMKIFSLPSKTQRGRTWTSFRFTRIGCDARSTTFPFWRFPETPDAVIRVPTPSNTSPLCSSACEKVGVRYECWIEGAGCSPHQLSHRIIFYCVKTNPQPHNVTIT